MALFRRSSSGRILAIDIGSSAIKVLIVHGQYPAPLSVVDFRIIHLTTTGKPFNITELPAVLSSVAHELHAGSASVRAAISGRHAVIRIVDMPKLPQDDLRRAMAFQLGRYVPIPPDEVTFDCTPLPGLPARDGSQKILLVALRRSIAEQHTQALRAAGLEPLLLDVEPLAAFNAIAAKGADFDRSCGLPHAPHGSFCLLHFGSAHLDLCIMRNGLPLACRMLEPGDAHYVTGGVADCPGVPELINRATHIPALRFDPCVNVNLGTLDNRVATLREHAAAFAPAMRLAVRSLHSP